MLYICSQNQIKPNNKTSNRFQCPRKFIVFSLSELNEIMTNLRFERAISEHIANKKKQGAELITKDSRQAHRKEQNFVQHNLICTSSDFSPPLLLSLYSLKAEREAGGRAALLVCSSLCIHFPFDRKLQNLI